MIQTTNHKRSAVRSGMTLVELLVVLIIIGILGAVTLRAMDTTRERANYEKTFKSMERLSQAITGNPNLVADGRRTDFGFVGDLGRLPGTLDELRLNTTGDSSWNGPYLRIPFEGDVESYKKDGWGQDLQYLQDQGIIISLANGQNPVTYRVVDDTSFLFRNSIAGTVTDNQGNPPGSLANSLRVRLWLVMPLTGQAYHVDTVPDPDGHYEFPASSFRIPVGNHRLTVVRFSATPESLTKFVTVSPRVGAIVDFRLVSSFIGALRVIENTIAAYGDQSEHVTFEVINTGMDTIRLDSVMFFRSDTAYCETLKLRRLRRWDYAGANRAGVNDSFPMGFSPPESVPGMARIPVDLKRFMSARMDPATPVNMHGKQLHLKFSDGSTVDVTIP